MATVNIGVLGPADLVELVLATCASATAVTLIPLVYEHEDQATELLTSRQDELSGVLFTGIVPWSRANLEGVLHRPAEHVSYSGATLLRALVEQLRLGHDIAAISIDTLARAQVLDTLTEARLPTDGVQVLEYRVGLTSAEVVDFHRRAHREAHTKVAITCLGSAYRQLSPHLHAVRLAPSRHSIRSALRHLELTIAGLHSGDAQVAIGLIDLDGASDRYLRRNLVALGATLARLDEGYLVVSTAGLLEQVTHHFRRWPLLDQLAGRHASVHIGFGIGRTAADAESLARRALGRAHAAGAVAAAIALADDANVIIGGAQPPPPSPSTGEDLSVLARRAGLGLATLTRLRDFLAAVDDGQPVTAGAVADHLAVEPRSARRILKRLERAGVAEPTGTLNDRRGGRPRTLYRLHI